MEECLITKPKTAIKDLIATNELNHYFEYLLHHTKENVYWLDLESRVMLCNLANARFCKYNIIEELIGKSIYDIYERIGWEREQVDAIRANDLKVIKTGEPIQVEEVLLFGNEKRVYLSSKSPIFDEAGNVSGVFGISVDIMNLKHQQKTLQTYLDYILKYSAENFYWLDLNSNFLLCNESQARFFGYKTAKDLIGKSIYDFAERLGWSKETADLVRENDAQVIQERKSLQFEEEAFFNGEKQIFLSSKAPFYDDTGKVIGLFGLTVDINKQKQREQLLQEARDKAEQANKEKTEFLAIINHELRTPLSAIIGMARIFKSESAHLSEKQQEIIDDMLHASEHLLSLVNEVLDYSKIQSSGISLSFVEFNLKDLLDHLVQTLAYQAKQKNIDLIFECSNSVVNDVVSEPKAIQRIMINMVGNAIKFTEHGHVKIAVHLNFESETSALLTMKISDTGIGIPKEKLSLIFEKFQQVDSSYSRRYGGTGLGLSIVKALILALKGTIEVESELGSGTMFTIQLPMKLVTKKVAALSENNMSHFDGNSTKKAFTKLKVLMVEDSKFLQRVHAMMVEKMGHEVILAVDGQEALSKYLDNFDVILLDIGLPDMSGYEVCTKIREAEKITNKHIPIVALTGYDDPESRRKCFEAGVDTVLSKPPEEDQLAEALLKFVKR